MAESKLESKSECKSDDTITALDEMNILNRAIDNGYFDDADIGPFRCWSTDGKFAVFVASLDNKIVTYIKSKDVMKFEHDDLFVAADDCNKWLDKEVEDGRMPADFVCQWINKWNSHLLELADIYDDEKE